MTNRTMLTHPATLRGILACTNAVVHGGLSVAHLQNRKGTAYLAFRFHDGKLRITDSNHKDVTQLVASTYTKAKRGIYQ